MTINNVKDQPNRKKARVSLEFKQKMMESAPSPVNEDIEFSDDSFYDDERISLLRKELSDCESYFLRKIQVYLNDFEEERRELKSNFEEEMRELKSKIELLEREIDETRGQLIESLTKTKECKNRIKELESKAEFYKNRLKKEL